MKILLISANRLLEPYPVYPLGLDYVAGAIPDRHEVRLLDLNLIANNDDALENAITEFAPGLIGISVRNIDNTDNSASQGFMGYYKDLIKSIKKVAASPIVLGGSGFTIFPREMLHAVGADYGIIGEGERLAALVDAIENNRNTANLPGTIARAYDLETSASIHIPPPLDAGFTRQFRPDASHVDFYLKKGGMLNLQTKRGCPFRCIYCTYPHIEGRKMRLIPADEIADTAKGLEDAGAKYIFISDSAFNADTDHSMEVAEAFIKKGISIPWGAFFAPISPRAGYFRLMKEAGCTHIEFGTEALSNQVLKAYGKPFSVDDVFAAHADAVDAGLFAAHYFLLGGPGENLSTLQETLSNVDKLHKTVLFFFCGMRIYPNTELYNIALGQGLISGPVELLEPVFYTSSDPASDPGDVLETVRNKAAGRSNWVIGAGGEETGKIIKRMHARGFSGPLWEYLIA